MSDDKNETSADRNLISLSEPYELRDWSRTLGCKPDVLREAVNAVGNSVDAVRRYLSQR